MWHYLTLILFFGFQISYSQSSCPVAKDVALKNYLKGIYTFHSAHVFNPERNTFLYLLHENFGINWHIVEHDSIEFYACYDSELEKLLQQKFGEGFLEKIKLKADSLDKTDNWNRKPEFPGGTEEMLLHIMQKLDTRKEDVTSEIDNTTVLLTFIVRKSGELNDIQIRRGINPEIDAEILRTFKGMPNWVPGLQFGKPIDMHLSFPLRLEFE